MGLTADIELSLRDSGLIGFFEQHRQAFVELAHASHEFCLGYVTNEGLPLRPDDVAANLVPALKTNRTLREFLQKKSMRQQYWYRYFADLIMDRLWEELSGEGAANGE